MRPQSLVITSSYYHGARRKKSTILFKTAATAALTFTLRSAVRTTSALSFSSSSPSLTPRNHYHSIPTASSIISPFPQFSSPTQMICSFQYRKQSKLYFSNKSITTETIETSDSDEFKTEFANILPFENHSHNSAKVIIPPKAQYSHNVDTDENNFESPTAVDDFSTSFFYDTSTPEQKYLFKQRLQNTIKECRNTLQKSSIWIEVPICRSSLMELMTDTGLEFHHAEGKISTLYLWLKDDTECKIPTFATHQMGVGAIVTNSRNEILCVRELRNNYMPWKLPGGLANLGEQIDEAAIREVYEETSIRTTFQSILGFRHNHNLQFGRSDLYFVCRLNVDTAHYGNNSVPDPIPEASEIADATWLPLQEYRDMIEGNNNDYSDNNGDRKRRGHPMMIQFMKIFDNNMESDIQRTTVSSVVPGRKASPVYYAPIRNNK